VVVIDNLLLCQAMALPSGCSKLVSCFGLKDTFWLDLGNEGITSIDPKLGFHTPFHPCLG